MTPPNFPSSVLNRIPNPFVFWKLWVAVLGIKSPSWIMGNVCMGRLITDVLKIILVLRLQIIFSSLAPSAGASSWSGRESRCSLVIVIVLRDDIFIIVVIITMTNIIFINMATISHHSDDVVVERGKADHFSWSALSGFSCFWLSPFWALFSGVVGLFWWWLFSGSLNVFLSPSLPSFPLSSSLWLGSPARKRCFLYF